MNNILQIQTDPVMFNLKGGPKIIFHRNELDVGETCFYKLQNSKYALPHVPIDSIPMNIQFYRTDHDIVRVSGAAAAIHVK